MLQATCIIPTGDRTLRCPQHRESFVRSPQHVVAVRFHLPCPLRRSGIATMADSRTKIRLPSSNCRSGWSKAGLFPSNPSRVVVAARAGTPYAASPCWSPASSRIVELPNSGNAHDDRRCAKPVSFAQQQAERRWCNQRSMPPETPACDRKGTAEHSLPDDENKILLMKNLTRRESDKMRRAG